MALMLRHRYRRRPARWEGVLFRMAPIRIGIVVLALCRSRLLMVSAGLRLIFANGLLYQIGHFLFSLAAANCLIMMGLFVKLLFRGPFPLIRMYR